MATLIWTTPYDRYQTKLEKCDIRSGTNICMDRHIIAKGNSIEFIEARA